MWFFRDMISIKTTKKRRQWLDSITQEAQSLSLVTSILPCGEIWMKSLETVYAGSIYLFCSLVEKFGLEIRPRTSIFATEFLLNIDFTRHIFYFNRIFLIIIDLINKLFLLWQSILFWTLVGNDSDYHNSYLFCLEAPSKPGVLIVNFFCYPPDDCLHFWFVFECIF